MRFDRVWMVFLLITTLPLFADGQQEVPAGADWPHFRGPVGTGTTLEDGWNPEALDGELKTLWKVDLGQGYAAPAVVGGYVFAIGNRKGQDTVRCLRSSDGKEIWSFSYAAPSGQYPGPLASPVVDGDVVYTLSREGDLYCLDARKGGVRWQRQIVAEYGVRPPNWKLSGSVVVHKNLLLINALRSGLALDKSNGEMVWKSEPGVGGYASPVVATLAGKTQALLFGSRTLTGVDPMSGEILWSVDWVTQHDVNAADPLVFGNRVFVSTNYRRGGAVFEITESGPRKIWENKEVSSHFSSFIYRDGYIYANSADANAHRGDFVCLEADTGRVMWRERGGVGSLIAAGNRLLLLSENRTLIVVELTPEAFRPLARTEVAERGLLWTAPVLSRGRLYVRSMQGELTCIDLSG